MNTTSKWIPLLAIALGVLAPARALAISYAFDPDPDLTIPDASVSGLTHVGTVVSPITSIHSLNSWSLDIVGIPDSALPTAFMAALWIGFALTPGLLGRTRSDVSDVSDVSDLPQPAVTP